MAGRDLARWWETTRLLAMSFAAAAIFLELVFVTAGSGAAGPGSLSRSLGIFAVTVLLPVALATVVFQHAGWQERNDARNQVKEND